jgi:hypothetical protein
MGKGIDKIEVKGLVKERQIVEYQGFFVEVSEYMEVFIVSIHTVLVYTGIVNIFPYTCSLITAEDSLLLPENSI